MDKIKIGIIGLSFGQWIVNDIVKNDATAYFTVAGVYDLNAERVAYVAKTYGVKAFGSLRDMLAAEDIEVIGLFTAPSGRAELIDQILDSGRDVITTKPFELDAGKAEAVLQKARRMGRKIMLNSPSPLPPPDLQQIMKWAGDYKLGKIIACRCDTWASYREKPDESWYDDAELCPVAPIFRLGIYLINDIVRLFGKASAVQVLQSRVFTRRPTPDNAQLGILFESGAIANVFASFCVEDGQYYKNAATLNFERGTITRNTGPVTREQTLHESVLSLVTLDSDKKPVVKHVTVAGSTEQYPWDAFYRILRGEIDIPQETDFAIVEAIRIVNAMVRAGKSGRSEAL